MKLWTGQTISLFGSALSRLAIPLIAALALNATPAEMGLLTAAGTAPSLLVGLFAGVWVDRIRRRTLLIVGDVGRALMLGAFVGSLEVLPVVFATPRLAVLLLLLSSLLGTFGWVLYYINAISLRQAITPMALHGRVKATFSFLVSGMLPLGAVAGGALAEGLGMRSTIILAALGSLFAFLWVLFSPVCKVRRIPEAT